MRRRYKKHSPEQIAVWSSKQQATTIARLRKEEQSKNKLAFELGLAGWGDACSASSAQTKKATSESTMPPTFRAKKTTTVLKVEVPDDDEGFWVPSGRRSLQADDEEDNFEPCGRDASDVFSSGSELLTVAVKGKARLFERTMEKKALGKLDVNNIKDDGR